ncbi:MAG: hypothetical protein KKD77_21495, partial [Gammaproteobacteria bacterium]|nr:hypothetical protein [Gammaproteobacteria bacterium]
MVYYVPPKYFRQEEFVDPWTYEYYNARGWDVWRLFRSQILYVAFTLRVRYGRAITINDWHQHKDKELCYRWRGFRTPKYDRYSAYSPHSMGGAIDLDVYGMGAEEV